MKINYSIRFAEAQDIDHIYNLILELAEYEKLSHIVKTSPESLQKFLFGDEKFIEVLVAEIDNQIIAYAIFFKNYSTFLGKPGIYLEDLYVKPEFRNAGVGKALLTKIFSIAKERNYGRVEWSVLDWNEPAINFYKKLGAELLQEWRIFRLSEDKF